MKDCKGKEIEAGDIVVWGYSRQASVAYVWDYSKSVISNDKNLYVGFDVRGPSCEDSMELSEFLTELRNERESLQVIGKMNN